MKLNVKNYTKIIKGKIILDNINLNLVSGKVYGFFGRNGSGKTMLFRAISTMIFPTEGDVLIDNVSLINDNYDLSKIGLLIEEPGFYPFLTGKENLSMLYEINNKKDDNYIVELLNEYLNLPEGHKRGHFLTKFDSNIKYAISDEELDDFISALIEVRDKYALCI